MSADLVVAAAMNNALWCDAVCRAHGLSTEFNEDTWVSLEMAPRLYPNLVTLAADAIDAQHARIADLRDSLARWGWAVKDSFNTLQLVSQGFHPVFHARWGTFDRALGERAQVTCSRVETAQELEVWKGAWCTYTDQDQAVAPFPPVLVDDPDIAFLLVRHGSEVLGGLCHHPWPDEGAECPPPARRLEAVWTGPPLNVMGRAGRAEVEPGSRRCGCGFGAPDLTRGVPATLLMRGS
jgi:hypothetical protein